MKAFKVKYHHGHFIDMESNKRLIPMQGKEYTITAEDNAFKAEDAKLLKSAPKNAEDKKKWALNEYGISCHKILNAGQVLFFRVGNSKRDEGDESREYILTCELKEDLYLYLLKDKNGKEAKHWRLSECICELKECIDGGLTLTENLKAQSLSMLFSYTVMFYFSLQRSASCNAFTTFFLYEKGMQITQEGAKRKAYLSLDDVRKNFLVK